MAVFRVRLLYSDSPHQERLEVVLGTIPDVGRRLGCLLRRCVAQLMIWSRVCGGSESPSVYVQLT